VHETLRPEAGYIDPFGCDRYGCRIHAAVIRRLSRFVAKADSGAEVISDDAAKGFEARR
jgi:hypothetical protein